jgi:hypothetical protein
MLIQLIRVPGGQPNLIGTTQPLDSQVASDESDGATGLSVTDAGMPHFTEFCMRGSEWLARQSFGSDAPNVFCHFPCCPSEQLNSKSIALAPRVRTSPV